MKAFFLKSPLIAVCLLTLMGGIQAGIGSSKPRPIAIEAEVAKEAVTTLPVRSIVTGSRSYDLSFAPRGERRAPEPMPHGTLSGRGSAAASAAPVTVWNEWPHSVSNKSIFFYLKGTDPFSVFVQTWHKSSCALVGYDHTGSSFVIGSGSYIPGHKVATARHCFEAYPFVESLYVRFFDYYEVGEREVKGRFMDIPVIGVENAKGGLDATYLSLAPVASGFDSYAKPLTLADDSGITDPFATLPPGSYAMFHFAGGEHHQISIGHVSVATVGCPLHDNIPISGGDGASGATIIRSTGPADVKGHGISIFRNMLGERRIIPFARFEHPGWPDSISAPYSLSIVSHSFTLKGESFDREGYEYLCWMLKYALDREGGKPGKISGYAPGVGHSNHHIIPITDLWFLWMYAFDSDDDLKASSGKPSYKKLKEQIELLKAADSSLDGSAHYEAYKARYESIQKLLKMLCPEWKSLSGKTQPSQHSTGFAWSMWNLFQGPANRSDNPKNDTSMDFSEKRKPSGFDGTLWNILKDDATGLFARIQILKRESMAGLPAPDILDGLIDSLSRLNTFWNDASCPKVIYSYDPAEWKIEAGKYSLL